MNVQLILETVSQIRRQLNIIELELSGSSNKEISERARQVLQMTFYEFVSHCHKIPELRLKMKGKGIFTSMPNYSLENQIWLVKTYQLEGFITVGQVPLHRLLTVPAFEIGKFRNVGRSSIRAFGEILASFDIKWGDGLTD